MELVFIVFFPVLTLWWLAERTLSVLVKVFFYLFFLMVIGLFYDGSEIHESTEYTLLLGFTLICLLSARWVISVKREVDSD